MRVIPARLWILVAVSGVLQLLPFPIAGPLPLWRTAFAWIALVPLLYAFLGMDKRGNPLSLQQTAGLGYLCGVIWYGGNCYWIYQTMYLYGGLAKPVALGILLLFALYLGLYHALFGLLFGLCRRWGFSGNGVLALAPFLWVTLELARARITGFPWDLLGLTQVDNPLLSRLATLTGTYGISFVVAAINSLWLVRIRVSDRPYMRPVLFVSGAVVIAAYLFALHVTPPPKQAPPSATVTLVQENLSVGASRTGPPETTEQMAAAFSRLSMNPSASFLNGIPEMPGTPEVVLLHKNQSPDAVEGNGHAETWTPQTDLIVWPESPAGFLTTDPRFLQQMHLLTNSTDALLVVGSLGVEPNADAQSDRGYFLYDSATFFRPQATKVERYDKIHLVPWGEYIPFKSLFSFAQKLTAGVGDMDRGTQRSVYSFRGYSYSAFVCYESIFGDEIRQFAKNGAEVLVNISDDGWYGDTGAAWQHLNMVRMRAIENHRWILRSTNTGVTAVIDPLGRVTAAAPRHLRTSLHAQFGYEKDITFYTAHGDLFAYACVLITAFALVFSLARSFKRGEAALS